jgi:hypothetical protein
MRSKLQKRSPKTGLAPGSLIHVGNRYTEKSKITLIRYRDYAGYRFANGEVFQKKEVDLAGLNFIALDKKIWWSCFKSDHLTLYR